MHNQRLKPSQACSPRRELQILHKALGGCEASLQLNAQNTRESAHLLSRQLVLWMRLEPRVVDTFNLWTVLEESGQRQRIAIVALYPQRQRPKTSQEKPTIEWAERCPDNN